MRPEPPVQAPAPDARSSFLPDFCEARAVLAIVLYGLWRGRGSNSVNKYLLAGKTLPWHAMALSIMATQASAVTFISTTGQSYVDGMRFVQFYFGLPVAMIPLRSRPPR